MALCHRVTKRHDIDFQWYQVISCVTKKIMTICNMPVTQNRTKWKCKYFISLFLNTNATHQELKRNILTKRIHSWMIHYTTGNRFGYPNHDIWRHGYFGVWILDALPNSSIFQPITSSISHERKVALWVLYCAITVAMDSERRFTRT